MQEKVPADSETVVSIPETSTVRPVRRRRLLRIGLVAAIMVIIILAATVTAYAFGYNLLGWVPKWNNDLLSFGEDESPEPNELHDSPQIAAALKELGINEPLYPTWLPEGFKLDYSVIETDPVFLHEGYAEGDRYLSITIEPSDSAKTYVYEKEDTAPLEYTSNDISYYIIFDNEQYTAVWTTEHYSAYIMGNITLNDMKQILDTIRGIQK